MTNDITVINVKGDHEEDTKGLDICLQEESVQEQAKNVRDLFSDLQGELDELEVDLKDGLSYLDMKNDTLLSYMIDLCNIILRKVRCDSISGHVSIERSVYYRVILEKIKVIDQRLAYQLNKVISMPEGATEENRAVNVKNLDIEIESSSDLDEEGEDDDEDDKNDEFDGSADGEEDGSVDDEESIGINNIADKHDSKEHRGKDVKPGSIYRPPKLRSVAYNDGKGGNSSKSHRDYDEFHLGDVDLDDDYEEDIVDKTHVHRDLDRKRYEEDNYTRLPDVNQKKAKRKLKTKNMSNKGKKLKGKKRKNNW